MIDWKTAQPAPKSDQQPEVCVNLWWFRDVQSGVVYRLAGRTYALAGSDEDKLRVLQSLAATDFHVARNFSIPKRFAIVTSQRTYEGITDQSIVVQQHAEVFREVFDALEKDLPMQMRSFAGVPSTYQLTLPQDPLCCTTCIHEYEDGSLIPQISQKAH